METVKRFLTCFHTLPGRNSSIPIDTMLYLMGRKGNCGPITHQSSRDRTDSAAVIQVISMTSPRNEGGYGRRDSTWSLGLADVRVGFSSVVLAGSPLAMP